jgi:nicotinamidase-related amidase
LDESSIILPEGITAWKRIVEIPDFDFAIERAALIIIDMTYQQASARYGICKKLIEQGYRNDLDYYLKRIRKTVVPNLKILTENFRSHEAPIIYTRCVSLRGDGSDQTWRHRSIGLVASLDSKDAEILKEIKPEKGDIVLNKTGSSVFTSTNAEHLLRNMGKSQLVVTGIFTNSCVEGTTRDAGDLGFQALIAEDACAAMSGVGHRHAIEYLDKNFCHVRTTSQIIELVR